MKTNRSSLARAMVSKYGAYNVTDKALKEFGGHWNSDYVLYFFPDGSRGAFTDLSRGASERNARGEVVLHFAC